MLKPSSRSVRVYADCATASTNSGLKHKPTHLQTTISTATSVLELQPRISLNVQAPRKTPWVIVEPGGDEYLRLAEEIHHLQSVTAVCTKNFCAYVRYLYSAARDHRSNYRSGGNYCESKASRMRNRSEMASAAALLKLQRASARVLTRKHYQTVLAR